MTYVPSANTASEYTVTLDPSEFVAPGLKYYAIATYSDGEVIKSPPVHEEFFAYTVAVWPNLPPAIDASLIPATTAANQELIVNFTVTDLTFSVASVTFFYREIGSPTVFATKTPGQSNSSIVDAVITLEAELFSDSGIEYYIIATDNFGVMNIYGSATNPYRIETKMGTSIAVDLQLTDVSFNCGPLQTGDIVTAYYVDDNGQLAPAGTTIVASVTSDVTFTIYGDDSGVSTPKNGYAVGDDIVLKINRNGVEDMSFEYYTPTFNLNGVYGAQVVSASIPQILVKGNYWAEDILHLDDTPSYADNTDFGISSQPKSAQFVIVNEGCAPLNISDVALTDDVNFTVSNLWNTTIQPYGNTEFTLTYEGTADASATVAIQSNASFDYQFDVTGQTVTQLIGNGNVSVSPNPATTGANVQYEVMVSPQEWVKILVLDIYGNEQQVIHDNYLSFGSVQNMPIDVNALQSGTYHVKVVSETSETSVLFIKQ